MSNNVCADLLQFGAPKSADELDRFREFVDRKKEARNDSYCVTDASIVVVSSSPFLCIREGFGGTLDDEHHG